MNENSLTSYQDAAFLWTLPFIGAAAAWGVGFHLDVPLLREVPADYTALVAGIGGAVAFVGAWLHLLGRDLSPDRHRTDAEELCGVVGVWLLGIPCIGPVVALLATLLARLAPEISGAHTLREASALVSGSMLFRLFADLMLLLVIPGLLWLALTLVITLARKVRQTRDAGRANLS